MKYVLLALMLVIVLAATSAQPPAPSYVRHIQTNKCLYTYKDPKTNLTELTLGQCENKFVRELVKFGNDHFFLILNNSNLCVQAYGAAAIGGKIQLGDCTDLATCKWIKTPANQGNGELLRNQYSQWCLDVTTQNGQTKLIQGDCNNSNVARWKFE